MEALTSSFPCESVKVVRVRYSTTGVILSYSRVASDGSYPSPSPATTLAKDLVRVA
jgi:hypothetical protein